MKKLNFLLLLGFAILICSCTKEEINDIKTDQKKQTPLSKSKIDNEISRILKEKGSFNWSEVSDLMLWSAVLNSDSIVSIGYGNKAFDISPEDKTHLSKADIITQISNSAEYTRRLKKGQKTLILENKTLNVIDVKTSSLEMISSLRNKPDVRYIEPAGYSYFPENKMKSSSGCGQTGETINPDDYQLIAPNCYVSWAYSINNIPAAWETSTGKGVTVAVIDTGVSENQPLLGNSFNNGYSSGRTIEKFGTYIDSWNIWSNNYDGVNDKCSHGTSMSANIASPRNDQGMPVGVAYNCNLIVYRATSDVFLDDYHEQAGVAEALIALANRPDVKIISMSIGHYFTIGKIEDAIKYAYSKDKLIFAAAGTSLEYTTWAGVIFPANMNETVAITGVTDASNYQHGAFNHYGAEVDFTVIMERYDDKTRTSPTTGFNKGEIQYIGGSSIATSMTAGIAALVWEKYPNYTRAQILEKLKQAAELYPNRDANYGYGNIDAYKAVN
ncbi:subtilase family protein [Ancylomarina subtilis]|uniref:Subtilase family protein n=1 Tax=Ancylomarina subtilis TaxID=1639035 RepID=A0A4Q7VLS1_9BACT|nr:S8/S53 family peptidase [Ancylomarina subtilis]RZT97067.1 subtilase family protein [Ancylomarina subtilis]